MPKMVTLPVFSTDEATRAKIFLATQVDSMMGRKLEEGDWSKVYCRAKTFQIWAGVICTLM
jgi:hypothetical protein